MSQEQFLQIVRASIGARKYSGSAREITNNKGNALILNPLTEDFVYLGSSSIFVALIGFYTQTFASRAFCGLRMCS